MDKKSGFRSVRSFAIVIRRAYFEAKKRRKYAKNVVVDRSAFTYPLRSKGKDGHSASAKLFLGELHCYYSGYNLVRIPFE